MLFYNYPNEAIGGDLSILETAYNLFILTKNLQALPDNDQLFPRLEARGQVELFPSHCVLKTDWVEIEVLHFQTKFLHIQ